MTSNRIQDLRRVVCEETAKIVIDQGIRDYQHAKRKACQRLSINPDQVMPANIEIEQAVATRLRIFDAPAHHSRYRQRLQIALELMDEFEIFHPRVNADSTVSPTKHSTLEIHAFADAPEDVYLFLHDRGMPFRHKDKRFRFNHESWRFVPSTHFILDEVPIEICIFRADRKSEIPRSQIHGKAVTRMNKKRLRQLLKDLDSEQH